MQAIRLFANACGFIFAGLVLFNGTVYLNAQSVEASTSSTSLQLMAAAASAFIAFVSVRFLGLLWAVRILRGPAAIGWVGPRSCSTFSRWLANDWAFYSNDGVHRGERLLGIEVAHEGALQ